VVFVLEDSFFLSLGVWQNEAAVLRDLATLLLREYRSGPFSASALISTSSNSDLIGKSFRC
jgi:hypothetical protein